MSISTHLTAGTSTSIVADSIRATKNCSTEMASFLITGGNRGLGLAIVKELISRRTSNVTKIVATTRNPSPELDELVRESSGRLAVIALDVSSELSVKQAVPELEMALAGKGLDVLVNNAGIAQYAMDGTVSM